jgi:plasmid replication initiation protein
VERSRRLLRVHGTRRTDRVMRKVGDTVRVRGRAYRVVGIAFDGWAVVLRWTKRDLLIFPVDWLD